MKGLSLTHELNLVREIMSTIKRFNNDHAISPAPGVIRDTLLVVAGLLHSEAVRLEGQDNDQTQLQETFVEIARANIKKALEAPQSHGRSSSH
jgi:hypothetical protein